jgi:hypothetical protein
MKKIKIIKARPLKEEEEVIDQQPQDVAPEQPTITFESNPLEFILQKYPTLTKTLVELLTEDFRDYITGVYIMAPKPTTFKIVLHNNRYFHLMFMGENKYEAKISGKKYWLAKLGELQLATLSIADLLMLGTPPSAEGPTEELPPAEGTESPEETPEETPSKEEEGGEEEGGVPELKESIQRFKRKLIESLLLEVQKREYEILTPEAKKIAQDLIKKLKITQDQIQPASSTNIVIYDDNRKDLVAKTAKLYGPPNDENSGNFKVGKISINFKPFMKSGEYYELKPQSLGVTLDKYITIDQLKKELRQGIKNHPKLDDTQKAYVTALVNGKGNLTPEQKQEIKDNTGFTNEVLKNLGEPLGAIMYANEIGATEIFFPKAGNYPLVDYLVKMPNGKEIQVSAKTAKGQGNIIKAPDVSNIIKQRKGKIDPAKQEILDILTTSSGKTGSLNLIPKFGDAALKRRLKQFLKDNPQFNEKGGKYNSLERIALEREMIKQINNQYQFDDEFNKYVTVRYVKYNADPNTLKGEINVVKNFDVEMASKNSKNHDGERIGFSLGKSE